MKVPRKCDTVMQLLINDKCFYVTFSHIIYLFHIHHKFSIQSGNLLLCAKIDYVTFNNICFSFTLFFFISIFLYNP